MNLPEVKNAPLPETYKAAKRELSNCSKIDECKSWANKAEALKSYAKQMQDDELEKMCQRIKLRAIKRAGELLEELESQRGKRTDLEPTVAADRKYQTRGQAAKDAGLSERQQRDAINIARAPNADEIIEQDPPPTVAALAEQGKKKEPVKMHCQHTIALMGLAEEISEQLQKISIDAVVENANQIEIDYIVDYMARVTPKLLIIGDRMKSLARRH